jgi:hypothetical protein
MRHVGVIELQQVIKSQPDLVRNIQRVRNILYGDALASRQNSNRHLDLLCIVLALSGKLETAEAKNMIFPLLPTLFSK